MVVERIIPVEYQDEMKQSYVDYAMSVIVDRALPDVRDGLKPVHRRVLYAMHEMGLHPSSPYRKSAKFVGETMSKYHPHGDAAIYDAAVRLSQDFSMMAPLIDGHGNFGSIDGDSAAAMRYTEAKLSLIALELLQDIKYNVVDTQPNFDNYDEEPVVLPAKFPNLLVNGADGIAVGMATYIPPHNLTEVIQAVIEYIKDPSVSLAKLMKHVKGPDFPTGGIITNKSELSSIYEKGRGTVRIRAKIEEEDTGYGKTNLVITEVPFTWSGNKSRHIEKIYEMARDRKLDELSDIRDESSKDGIRIVLEVKRGVNIENFLNKLYKKTPLEDTLSVNMLCLVDGAPMTPTLKEMIHYFVEFQREITLKKYNHLLAKAKDRQEVLLGLLRAIDVIDTIIEVLRGSRDVKMVRACLMHGAIEGIRFKSKRAEKEAAKLAFTERQVDAILGMRLQNLIQLEVHQVSEELDETLKHIQSYEDIVTKEDVLLGTIKEYLTAIKKQFGSKRKTEIVDIETADYVEEIKEEEWIVLVDRFGYVKTTDVANYKRSGEDTQKEFSFACSALNIGKVGFLTSKGNFCQTKTMSLPKGKMKDKGVPLDTIFKISKDESVVWMGSVEELLSNQWLFVTKRGMVKVVAGVEFDSNRSFIAATKLDDGDEVVSVKLVQSSYGEQVVLLTNHSNALKFATESLSIQKKQSKGVKGIELQESEFVAEVWMLQKGETLTISWKNDDIDLHSIKVKKPGQKGGKLKGKESERI
ncbi:DNA topoisomerase 4 subunit A [Fodinisporobacter ferrooxydans]|uniref:DNA topoisomerase (ATP-hydrolyzing) n=1 Tax=Fodinisporobacter ferrooxydans TaxID=2901836 RepID=A0ABY4CII2_9BACL|nr:DNA topoisomerase 4 subunit A [Alicyclobacillaceae bacterium MYW30-H2]